MDYIKLMRPKHYIKNLLVFLPLIFSGLLTNQAYLIQTIIGYIAFCLTASTIYIMNDIRDKEKDKKHTKKKNRPIASGRVPVKNAIILIVVLLIAVTLILYFSKINMTAIIFLVTYFVINIGYSFGLKNVPLVDIAIIVAGFVIRVLYGGAINNIETSNWLYLTIITLSFYLALGKRRNEISKEGKKARKVLKYYTQEFLDKNMYMFLSMAIVFYSLWATSTEMVIKSHNRLIITIPIIMLLCMRYSMNIEDNSDGDPTEVIIKDKVILGLGTLLGIGLIVILYG